MGSPYQSQSASGYNSSPPPDDGSVSAANKLTWAKIKTQLGDAVKGLADAINTALRTALNVTPTTQTTAYTTTAADHLRPIEVTGTTTISLGDAATMVAQSMGYEVTIANRGVATVTVSRITGADTLNGSTTDLTLAPGQSVVCAVNSTNNGYHVKALAHMPTPGAGQKFAIDGGFSTGDVKLTLKTVADSGWVLMNDGTIGSATSGATTRANADTTALYTLLWNNTANADCAVSTGRGANAAADFAANKTIALPKSLGRALATYGAGSGLTSRALASVLGEETHVLTAGEAPALTTNTGPAAGGAANAAWGQSNAITATITTNGGGGAHNNMQPTVFLNVMIKL